MEQDTINTVGDITSGAVVVTTLLGWLPHVVAVLAAVWYVIRIYEWAEARFFKKDISNAG